MALKINVLNISCLYNKNEFNLNYIKRFFLKLINLKTIEKIYNLCFELIKINWNSIKIKNEKLKEEHSKYQR